MSYEPRTIINGALLKQYIGKNVSIFLKVDNVAASGTSLVGETSDKIELRVALSDPLNAPLNGWIEVIGSPAGIDTIRCKEIINFEQQDTDEEFDTNGHNMMIMYWQNCREIYRTG